MQQFEHPNNSPGTDGWTTLTTEGKHTAHRDTATKWRIVSKTPKPNGMLRPTSSPPSSDMGPDNISSSGDLWVLRHDGSQDARGGRAHRRGASTRPTSIPGTVVDGADVVVWHRLRHHHQTRQVGEETITPLRSSSFHVEPRDFLNGTRRGCTPRTRHRLILLLTS